MEEHIRKNKEEKAKGITLIALVVTIVVLLILAGVTINAVFNNNGIIAQARRAKEEQEKSVETDKEKLNELDTQLEEILNPTLEMKTMTENILDKNTKVKDENGNILVVPKGFRVIKNANGDEKIDTVEEGIVIADRAENEYVWIPVEDINSMTMCTSNRGTSVCNLKLQNGTLKCTNPAHTATATELVGRLYTSSSTYKEDESGKKIYSYKIDFYKTDQTYSANSGNREPAVVTGKSTGDGTSYDGDEIKNYHGEGTAAKFLTELKKQYKEMATNVAKMGGFYVSRYEIGEGGASKKGQSVLNASTTSANRWYGLYNVAKSSSGTIKGQMIWGSQYDQIIKFIGEEGQIGHSDRDLAKSTPQTSGANEKDRMKNIYDLEGNYFEWTAEASNTVYRVSRGGYYLNANNGLFFPASNRSSFSPTITGSDYSSRRTLYVTL